MPVSISMNVTETSVDTANNRSYVSVVVTAHYTGGSFNRNDPPLTVTLDGVSETVNVDFNASELTSGSEVIYSQTWYVEHNSDGTKTLYYSASYVTGVSSGTVSTSGSLVLTSISTGSSGGDSGDDDDDDSGGSDGGDSGGGSSGNDPGGTESSTPSYQCYISTLEYTDYLENCTVTKLAQIDSNGTYHDDWEGVSAGKLSDGSYRAFIVYFKTPDMTGVPQSVHFSILPMNSSYGYRMTLGYSLCTSDANRNLYPKAFEGIQDENQVASGTVAVGTTTAALSFSVTTTELETNANYCLFLWYYAHNSISTGDSAYISFNGLALSHHTITFNTTGEPINVVDKPYDCYIDDGTAWYPYTAHTENGTSWDS